MEKDTRVLKALILSDGRRGHENQSVAFCRLLNVEYEIKHIKYKNRLYKLFSYGLDFLNIKTWKLYENEPDLENYDFAVGTGSETYYALKMLNSPVALMAPKGYKNTFFKVFINETDEYKGSNVIKMPVNFSYLKPSGYYNPIKKSIAFVIGGSNKVFQMDDEVLEKVKSIIKSFEEYETALSTSPRTPKHIEEELKKMNFDYKVIFSENPINPLGDFAYKCEYVFITMDSVSMISELVSWGSAKIVVIPLKGRYSKFHRFVENLRNKGYLSYIEDAAHPDKKVDLKKYINKTGLTNNKK